MIFTSAMRWALPTYITRLLGARRPQSLGSELTTIPTTINHPDKGVSSLLTRASRQLDLQPEERQGRGGFLPPFPPRPWGGGWPCKGGGSGGAQAVARACLLGPCHPSCRSDWQPPARKLTSPFPRHRTRSKARYFPISRIRKPRPRNPRTCPAGSLVRGSPQDSNPGLQSYKASCSQL